MNFERLKLERKKRGYTQQNVADFLEVQRATYAGWETGKDIMPLRQLFKVANNYQISLDYLTGLSNTNSKVKSKTTKIEKRLAALKNGKLDVIVATTILERGITVDNVQVIVLQGNNRVFNQSTLIQICGRVGRNINHPNGSISIFTPYKTKAIKKCISTIKQDNA